jgi:hypothetical protein
MKIKITREQRKFLIEASENFLDHPEECMSYFCHYMESEAKRKGFERRTIDKIIRIVAEYWKHSLRCIDWELALAFIPERDDGRYIGGDPSHPMRRKFVRFFLKHIRETTPTKINKKPEKK